MFKKKEPSTLYNYYVFKQGGGILDAELIDWNYGNDITPVKGDVFLFEERGDASPTYYFRVFERQFQSANYVIDGQAYNVLCNVYFEQVEFVEEGAVP